MQLLAWVTCVALILGLAGWITGYELSGDGDFDPTVMLPSVLIGAAAVCCFPIIIPCVGFVLRDLGHRGSKIASSRTSRIWLD